MLLALASLAALAQDLVRDRPIEIQLGASDPVLEDHGPGRTLEYDVTFDGALHVWASSSDFDPILRVTRLGGELLTEDDDSGGGTTAYVALLVGRNELLSITVAAANTGAAGKLVMHVSEAPETEATIAAAARALEELAEVKRLREARSLDEARVRVIQTVNELLSVEGARTSDQVANACGMLGSEAHRLAELGSANAGWGALREYRERALPEDHPLLQSARGNVAVTLLELGNLAEARALFERVLGGLSRTLPDDHPDLQLARLGLAATIKLLGDLAGARTLEEHVLEVRSRTLSDDHPLLQVARTSLGGTLYSLGDLGGARALFEQVFEVRSRTLPDDHPSLQLARINLASTCSMLGDLAGARALSEKALKVLSFTLPDDHPDLQKARQGLEGVLSALGDLAGARALSEKVLEVNSRTLPDDHPDLQAARLNLALLVRELGDLAGARTLEERVFEVNSRTLPDDHPDLQLARQHLASTIKELGDLPAARALQEKVLEVNSRTLPEDHTDVQLARAHLAGTMAAQGNTARARALLEQVLEVQSRTLPEDHPHLQNTRENLAFVLADQQAREGGGEGKNEGDPEGNRAAFLRLASSFTRALARSARLTICTSSSREAEERCAGLQKELGGALSCAAGLSVFAPDALLEQEAFLLSEATRGAAVSSARFARRAHSDRRYPGLRAEMKSASEELSRLQQSAAGADELGRARARREGAERELVGVARELAVDGAGFLDPEVAALSSLLNEGEALVGYRRYTRWEFEPRATRGRSAESLCSFVVRPKNSLQRVDLGPIEPIERAVERWRKAIGVRLERGVVVTPDLVAESTLRGQELRRLAFDPLAAALEGVERVVVAADDVLNLVPLDALPLDQSSGEADQGVTRLIGDRWRIETRCSLTELLWKEAPPSGGEGLLALGGASFNLSPLTLTDEESAALDDEHAGSPQAASLLRGGAWERGFEPLTHSGPEARGIAALYEEIFEGQHPSLVLEKRKASRASLAELAPKARFLHIATHGWFAPDSVRSIADPEPLDVKLGFGARMSGEERVRGMSPMLLCGLALGGANLPEDELARAPGLLTAEEVSTFDLAGCELAVLSACDTNVGIRRAGQGVASLQKALHMAGARSVITSLWKVPDEATKELMLDFYRRLWVEKKPKWQALWEAKMRLRNARDEQGRPRYSTRDWAAWVLTGEPD